ncbi:MAG TPA: coproporphyrinogen dehydrogenase HemZ [Defluviitaleaceae bacterium]|mgnify:FL=1|nr:coproporphyrinogen dehydrogenase HemZ [Defluviitaleaceae bacterium]
MTEFKLVGHQNTYQIENIIRLYDKYLKDVYIISILKDNTCRAEIYDNNNLIVYKEEKSPKDPKLQKQKLASVLYKALVEVTKKEMPWGFLTGIRPTKIVHELMEEKLNEEEIKKQLINFYYIREDKANLMIEVAKKEKEILDKNKDNEISLYIGIPFCPSKCLYCSFTSYAIDNRQNLVEDYLEALEKEILFSKEYLKDKYIRSLYIGGGTPTSLNLNQLERLLIQINKSFFIEELDEFTVEAGRPDTITREKLNLLKQYNVDRISINPQTMDNDTLVRIGRKHSKEEIIEAFYMAREAGFDNINMDIILGLPGEDTKNVSYSMSEIKKLSPDSLTVHTMAIKRASRLSESLEEYSLIDEDKVEKMLDITYQAAISMGMKPYYLYRQKNMLGNFENVGYSKVGKESIYNIQIMEEKESIIALGAGAITKLVYKDTNRIERIPNVKNVYEYIKRIDEMILRKESLLQYE